MVGFPALLDELIELVREDAEALSCSREVAHAKKILARGTSAHRQLAVYDEARQRGAERPRGAQGGRRLPRERNGRRRSALTGGN